MTMLLSEKSNAPTDADLVAASRLGDREAFGRIVRRYQNMVTGVIYAGCGDVHRSEDLAQDTFISAWKSLSGLREPAKLPAWLCQVARHRLVDSGRSNSRREARLSRVFQTHQEPTSPSPEEQALSEEERALLWHALREVAQPYRETLVLYYRQGKSTDDVALAMDTTEANVRQRLSRGRAMLREQVAGMLERNLLRSAPGPAFAVAVVAALPALIPQAATAATIGATVMKGAAAGTKGASLLALATLWIGPFFGVAGGAFGTWASIRRAQNPRERKFVVRTAIETWILVVVAMASLFGLLFAQRHYHWHGRTIAVWQSAFWLIYAAVLVGLVVVRGRQHRRIRKEEGLPAAVAMPPGRYWLSFGGATVGALAWMFALAVCAGDRLGAAVVGAACVALVVVCYVILRGRPSMRIVRRFALAHALLLGLITLAMVNWRIYVWFAAADHASTQVMRERIPLWTVNLFTCAVYAFVVLVVQVSMRTQVDADVDQAAGV